MDSFMVPTTASVGGLCARGRRSGAADESVQRTGDSVFAEDCDFCVEGRCFQSRVTEVFLDESDVRTVFQQVRCECVAEAVWCDVLRDTGQLRGLFDDTLYRARRDVASFFLRRKQEVLGGSGLCHVSEERFEALWEHDLPIGAAFSLPDGDNAAIKVDVAIPQAGHFADADSKGVEQSHEQFVAK